MLPMLSFRIRRRRSRNAGDGDRHARLQLGRVGSTYTGERRGNWWPGTQTGFCAAPSPCYYDVPGDVAGTPCVASGREEPHAYLQGVPFCRENCMAVGQVLVNWLLLGSLYAAVALGFSLVWGIMNIVNLAHGAFIIVGAYTAFWLYTQLHIDPYLGIPLTMAVLFGIGWIVQYVAINRVIRAPLLVTFLLTFGLNLLIADLVQQFFSSDLRSINTAYAGNGIDIGSTHIAFDRLIAAAIAVLLTAALNYFLTRTRIGNAILATGIDRDAARPMDLTIRNTSSLPLAILSTLPGAPPPPYS